MNFIAHRRFAQGWFTAPCTLAVSVAQVKHAVYWSEPTYIEDVQNGRIVAYSPEKTEARRRWTTCNRAYNRRSLRDLGLLG